MVWNPSLKLMHREPLLGVTIPRRDQTNAFRETSASQINVSKTKPNLTSLVCWPWKVWGSGQWSTTLWCRHWCSSQVCCENEAVLQRKEHRAQSLGNSLPPATTGDKSWCQHQTYHSKEPGGGKIFLWGWIFPWEEPGIPMLTGKLCILR